jgi:glycosyltransferase involved in cell wall biosynthesis
LVMLEARACGTPIIAYRHRSVPEVLADGITGFIVDELEDAVKATERITTLSRSHCRQPFEQRFGVTRMAEDYVAIYRRLTDTKPTSAYAG